MKRRQRLNSNLPIMHCMLIQNMAARRANQSTYVCPVLFLKENGEPLNFYLHKSSKDKVLIDLIERGGGTICKRPYESKEMIKLADPSQEQLHQDYISSTFVMDSVKNEVAQDVTKYKLNRPFEPRFTHVVHYKEDEQDSSFSSINSRRKRYTYNDDMKIIKYVEKHATEDMPVGGNVLWKQMEKEKITNHSWQSMQKHFRVFLQNKMHQNPQNLVATLTLSRLEKPKGNSTPTKSKAREASPKPSTSKTAFSPSKKSKYFDASPSAKTQKRTHSISSNNNVTTNKNKPKQTADDDTDDSSVDDFDEQLIKIARKKTRKIISEDDNGDDHNDVEFNHQDQIVESPNHNENDYEEKEENGVEHDDDDTQDVDSVDHETSAKDTQDEDDGHTMATRSKTASSPHRTKQPLSPAKSKSPKKIVETSKPSHSRLFTPTLLPHLSIPAEGRQLWDKVDKQFSKIGEVRMLPSAEDLSTTQIFQVLYVTSGSVDEAKHYIETGKLSNGEPAWSPEEDVIIKTNHIDGLRTLFKRRGRHNVIQRKSFLDSLLHE